ncbi:restriction endonuclease subunit S [Maribacter sp. 1_MG-2023]|uniref:restriction endonuclease subunit S n=1 Tax=Maribacter sp. 1_MG-2023 TaxID=3062677 RepID=UPI0026E48EAF|nr:restriction endonuclease subunit S [Maribacter sp. 1_MG-2023]MDO6470241.1 restriction endonuclease subunit S [Maribacter sp. 1_MG-2023]
MASRGDIDFIKVQPTLYHNWIKIGFEEALKKAPKYVKHKTKGLALQGKYPVVDQGDTLIAGYIDDEKSIYKGDTPVIIFGDHTRHIKYIDFTFAVGADGTKILKPSSILNEKFYYYYLKSLKIPDLGYSRHFKILKEVQVPLPPRPEQDRIVAKVDILMAQVSTMQKSLERIPQLLKDFRQQVLTQAVTGKLTEEWREGKELEKWNLVFLKDITNKIGSGSTPKGGSKNYKKTGIPLVRSMNIHFNGIKSDGLAFLDKKQAEKLKNVEIHKNDILLNITGASIGRVCIAEDYIVGGRVNQHVNIIRLNEGISPKYVNMYLSSSQIQNYIFNENYGVTRQALTKTQTQNLQINLPQKAEQLEIVQRVDFLLATANEINKKYKILKNKIDSLPQAILHKAFKGELVEQLPTDGDAKDLLREIEELRKEKI